MLKKIADAAGVIKDSLIDFVNLNFGEIVFSDLRLAYFLISSVLLLVTVKIIFRWFRHKKTSQRHSGWKIISGSGRGTIIYLTNLIIRTALIVAVGFMALALADPFLLRINEERRIIESRIRVDLRDASTSMESPFSDSGKSKAQIAAEAHLEFLKMRKGKNDRTSLWLFASYVYKIEDFIVDDDLYYQQVEDSCWVIGYSNQNVIDWYFENHPGFGDYIPKEKICPMAKDGGGTDIKIALQAVIRQFDSDKASKAGIKKSVLIITDAEVAGFPSDELVELRKRKVVPFVILINAPNATSSFTPEFATRIKEFGGQYFDVRDEDALKRAFQAIDRIEATKVEITKKTFKIDLFQTFLIVAIAILITAVFISLILEPFGIYP